MLPPRRAVLCRRVCLMAFNFADESSYGDAVLRGVAEAETGRSSRALVVLQCPPTHSSHTRAGGYPVRRGLSIQSLAPLEYWITRPSAQLRTRRVMTAE